MNDVERRAEKLKALNERQRAVLRLVCQGLSYREVADALFVSLSTVHYHMANVYARLELDDLPRRPGTESSVSSAKRLAILRPRSPRPNRPG